MDEFAVGLVFAGFGLFCLAALPFLRRRAIRAGENLTFPTVVPLIFAALFLYWAWRLIFHTGL